MGAEGVNTDIPSCLLGCSLRALCLWVRFFGLVLTGSAQDHVIGLVQPVKELLLLTVRKEAGFSRFDVLEKKHTKKMINDVKLANSYSL